MIEEKQQPKPETDNILRILFNWLRSLFSLREGAISEEEILRNFSGNYEFKGARLWVLILAMLIASVGLNVNSTAVIIGAMLISPLMDPIIAIGVGVSSTRFDLIRKSFYQLAMAVVFSVITSSLYFLLSPIKSAQSELLARTEPAIWDVFIAFFGGLAGIIGVTRANKGNTLAGVAIATALMPPLCTAGYGIATAQWKFFFGAFYLFTINTVFIICATVAITSLLRFRQIGPKAEKKTQRMALRTVLIAAAVTLLPSVYLGYKMVTRNNFEKNAQEFIEQEFNLVGTSIINQKINYDGSESSVEVYLLGKRIPAARIKEIKLRLKKYNLEGTALVVHQGDEEEKKANDNELYMGMVDKMYYTYKEQIEQLRADNTRLDKELKNFRRDEIPTADLLKEVRSFYPHVYGMEIARSVLVTETNHADSVLVAYLLVKNRLIRKEEEKLAVWLKERLKQRLPVHVIQQDATVPVEEER